MGCFPSIAFIRRSALRFCKPWKPKRRVSNSAMNKIGPERLRTLLIAEYTLGSSATEWRMPILRHRSFSAMKGAGQPFRPEILR